MPAQKTECIDTASAWYPGFAYLQGCFCVVWLQSSGLSKGFIQAEEVGTYGPRGLRDVSSGHSQVKVVAKMLISRW